MNDQKQGILIIVSGFAGAGKGTVVRKLLEMYPDTFKLSVSATTRTPRPGEEEGVHYFYKSRSEFEKMIADGALLEYAEYVGNYYGTPREYVQTQLEAGYDVLLEIEQQGAFQVKKSMPEAILVFLTPPTIEELEQRLRGRNTETEQNILSRMGRAAIEAENIELYDYIVFNEQGDAEGCALSLYHLTQSEHMKTCYNQDRIQELQDGLQVYRKGE